MENLLTGQLRGEASILHYGISTPKQIPNYSILANIPERTCALKITMDHSTFSRYCLSYLKGCLVNNLQNFLKESYRNVNVALY